MRRILTALLLIPPLLTIILLTPPWAFLLLAEAVALVAAHEFFGIARRGGYRPFHIIGYLGTALAVASFYPPAPEGRWAALCLVVGVGAAALRRGSPGPGTLADVAVTVLGAAYAGFLTGSMVGLRLTVPDGVGRSLVFFLLLVVMVGDTGAYYTGKGIGRRPLAPVLSPKKTLEGFFGQLVSSVAVAVAVGPVLLPRLGMLSAAALGLVLALLGVAGDLFESLLKRSAGVKDASSIFPGHGGVLDRLDSLLFSAPALLLYVQYVY